MREAVPVRRREIKRRTAKALRYYRERLVLYVCPFVLEALEALAKDEGVSRSEYCGTLLEQWILSMDRSDFTTIKDEDRILPRRAAHDLDRALRYGNRRQCNRHGFPFPAPHPTTTQPIEKDATDD